MPATKGRRVDLRDADAELAKTVLEAAEALAGKPMEVRGLAGRASISSRPARNWRASAEGGLAGLSRATALKAR
jgi:hypothetical protein